MNHHTIDRWDGKVTVFELRYGARAEFRHANHELITPHYIKYGQGLEGIEKAIAPIIGVDLTARRWAAIEADATSGGITEPLSQSEAMDRIGLIKLRGVAHDPQFEPLMPLYENRAMGWDVGPKDSRSSTGAPYFAERR